jgi:hypothetical protein
MKYHLSLLGQTRDKILLGFRTRVSFMGRSEPVSLFD